MLLNEARGALSGRADTVVLERLDEAILQLAVIESEQHISPGRIGHVLRILGDGLALIPAIAELLQRLHR